MMRIKKSSIGLAIVFALVAGVAQADDAAKTGTIKGRIIDANKSPVAKFTVKLVKPERRSAGGGRGGSKKSTDLPNGLFQEEGMMGGKVIAKTATDANGIFRFNNVQPGGYTVEGGNMNVGFIGGDVAIEAGKEFDLGDQTPQK